jgi:hypothetical protein
VPHRAPSRAVLLLGSIALAVGVVDGLVFLGFEWVVKHGTNWLWNDVVDSDDVRWRVVPLALALSIALSALMRALGQPRWTPPHMAPLGPAEGSADEPPPPSALSALAAVLLVGAAGPAPARWRPVRGRPDRAGQGRQRAMRALAASCRRGRSRR